MAEQFILGHRNYAEDASLSGGTFHSSWPIGNIQERRIENVAIMTVITSGAAYVQFDLGTGVDEDIRLLGIYHHNISSSGVVRWRGADSVSGLTSGAPVDEIDSVWKANYTPANSIPFRAQQLTVLGSGISHRYWRMDIYDPNNSEGQFELGYVFIMAGFQPNINMSYGAERQLESHTILDEAVGLVDYFDERPNKRGVSFVLENLSENEADTLTLILARNDIHTPVYFCHNPEQPTRWIIRSFLGRLRTLESFEMPSYEQESVGILIKEWYA